MLICLLSRRKITPSLSAAANHRIFSSLSSKYPFNPPSSLHQNPTNIRPDFKPTKKKLKPQYKPPSSLDRTGKKPVRSDLPFDFRFSYTESSQVVRPIGLREPKYSPFGPDRVDRVWTGVCAPALNPKLGSVDDEGKVELNLEEKRKKTREKIQGQPLTNAERKALVERFQKHRTKRQINIGRDGLTHNMLNDIHNHWKHDEAVRIKCMGVPTVDMKNVCTQLEDKTFGQIIQRHGGLLILYRGRNYHPRKRPVIPLMLWKPQEPVYPRLIKTTIEGLNIEETKEMRKRGLAVPALTRLAKNGYYGCLVPMVRDAFLMEELIRIDCKGLEKSDYKKIGCKLRDIVPCILVTFDKEQIVIWRGYNYKPHEGGIFLTERESYDDRTDTDLIVEGEPHENTSEDVDEDVMLLAKAQESKKENPSQYMVEMASVETMFRFVDAKNTGRISYKQFLVGSSHILKQPLFRQACQVAFTQCDANLGDAILPSIPNINEDEIQEVFKLFDKDGDGKISKDDFMTCLRRTRFLISLFWWNLSQIDLTSGVTDRSNRRDGMMDKLCLSSLSRWSAL